MKLFSINYEKFSYHCTSTKILSIFGNGREREVCWTVPSTYHLLFFHNPHLASKSLYISRTMSNFYGTLLEIWAGFGQVGSTAQPNLLLGTTFDGVFYMFFGRFFLNYCSIRTKKLHRIKVIF